MSDFFNEIRVSCSHDQNQQRQFLGSIPPWLLKLSQTGTYPRVCALQKIHTTVSRVAIKA